MGPRLRLGSGPEHYHLPGHRCSKIIGRKREGETVKYVHRWEARRGVVEEHSRSKNSERNKQEQYVRSQGKLNCEFPIAQVPRRLEIREKVPFQRSSPLENFPATLAR